MEKDYWIMRCVRLAFILLLTIFFSGFPCLFGQEPVQLVWDPNSEPDLAGYNMYRSNQSGFGYDRLNTALITVTTYTDDTIVAGQTYYYVCTAVNTSDLESGFSNEVPYTVPGGSVCPGEVNGDGVRNVLDVILIMNHIVGNVTLEGDNLLAADVNEDSSVNVLDTVLLQNYVVGNVSLPACP
jgi:hypothetical protein